MRKFKEFEYPVHPGDLLVVFTDGISNKLDVNQLRNLSVQEAADFLLHSMGKDHDDATCIIIKILQADES